MAFGSHELLTEIIDRLAPDWMVVISVIYIDCHVHYSTSKGYTKKGASILLSKNKNNYPP